MTAAKWLAALGVWLLAGCTENTLFHSYQSIGEEGWRRTDTLCFTLAPSPTPCLAATFVEIRLDRSFPYRELWLQLEKRSGEKTEQDTLCFRLTDETESLSGKGLNLLQYELAGGNIRLQEKTGTELRLHHLMEREIMPHISEVGIRVERQ